MLGLEENNWWTVALFTFLLYFFVLDTSLFLMMIVAITVSELFLFGVDVLTSAVKQFRALAALDKKSEVG